MSEGFNQVILMGNLGADPELRVLAGGNAVLKIRLATSHSWWDRGSEERKTATEWHSVTVWGKRAEGLSKILSKGSRIMVQGSLRTSKYDDRDGVTRYRTEVVASQIVLAGGTTRLQENGEPAGFAGQDFDGAPPGEDDIPF